MGRRVVVAGFVLVIVLTLAGCQGNGGVIGQPEPRTPGNDPRIAQGRALIASYGCGSCHTIPGVPGARAYAAPPLERFWERSFIAGRLANTEDNLVNWIRNPQSIDPGNAMPNLGVTEQEARNMAAFLYHQPTMFETLLP